MNKKEIKDFIEANADVFKADSDHFKNVRAIIGSGWDSVLADAWDAENSPRNGSPKLSVNPCIPFTAKIMQEFTKAPYKLVADSRDVPYSEDSLNNAIRGALYDMVTCGKGYILTYIKNETLHFRRLDNAHTIYTPDKVMFVERKPKPADFGQGRQPEFKELELNYDYRHEILQATIYERTEEGALAYVWDGSEEDPKPEVLDFFPVEMMCGDECWVDDRITYRGVYFQVMDLLGSLNGNLSLIYEKILSAPNFKFWVPIESLADRNYANQLKEMNGKAKAVMPFLSKGPNGEDLQPPTLNQSGIGAEDLTTLSDVFSGMIHLTLGDTDPTMVGGQAKTAEEILMQRDSQMAAYNRYIFACNSCIIKVGKQIGKALGYKVEIASGPYDAIKKQDEMAKVIAWNDYAKENKQLAPLLLDYMDIEQEKKSRLIASLEIPNVEEMQANLQMLTEAGNRQQADLEAARGEVNRLTKSIEDLKVQQAIDIEKIKADYDSALQKAEIDYRKAVDVATINARSKEPKLPDGLTEEDMAMPLPDSLPHV